MSINILANNLANTNIIYSKDYENYYDDYQDFLIDFNFLKKSRFKNAILIENGDFHNFKQIKRRKITN